MAFLTPCFVRVEDPAERQKLIEWCNDVIGRTGDEDYTYGDVVLCIKDTTYCCCYEETEFVANDTTIDCGISVDLFRALAAMNDENDREQWFVVKKNISDFYDIDDIIYQKGDMFFNESGEPLVEKYFRKATAEEIVEYFKKREE